MIVNKKSWHYNVYRFTYTEGKLPERTNLCQYFWRCVLVAPLFCLFIAVITTVMLIVRLFNAVFAIGRPSDLKNFDTYFDSSIPFKGVTMGRWRITHAVITVPLAVLGVIWGLDQAMGRENFLILAKAVYIGIGILAAAIVCIACIIGISAWSKKTESGKLLRAQLAAKKTGICPVIEFKDEPTGSSAGGA